MRGDPDKGLADKWRLPAKEHPQPDLFTQRATLGVAIRLRPWYKERENQVKLKPLGRRGLVRSLAVGGLAVASVTSLVLTQTPALADPGFTYVAVGSDTIQDFENGWAAALTPGTLASYNATNPENNTTTYEVITPVKKGITTSATQIPGEACSFDRPNGSGDGSKALQDSLGLASVDVGSTIPQTNCVDIARSSSGPAVVDSQNGAIQFIPFALDAVTSAVGPSSSVTIENAAGTGTESAGPTNLSALIGVGFTKAGLQAMFGSGDDAVAANVTSGSGVCYAPYQGGDLTTLLPAGVTCSSTVIVDLYIPQPNSGTLKFWAQSNEMNFNASSPPAWDHQHIVNGAGTTLADYAALTGTSAVSVEEHDGTAFAADPNGIGPFSIAQWIAQNNGINPRFHGAQLLPINSVSPLTGTLLNTSFPITRQVYNAVAYDRVINTGDGFYDPILAQLLVTVSGGAKALLCQQTLLIQHYGFGVLNTTDSPNGTACGDTTASLYRADS